jgi:uncharacterized membrane protein YhaH (DUF805 family)
MLLQQLFRYRGRIDRKSYLIGILLSAFLLLPGIIERIIDQDILNDNFVFILIVISSFTFWYGNHRRWRDTGIPIFFLPFVETFCIITFFYSIYAFLASYVFLCTFLLIFPSQKESQHPVSPDTPAP